MSFTSLEFPLFLGLCLALIYLSTTLSVRTLVLTVCSYAFYMGFGRGGIALITLLALADFSIGNKIGSEEDDRVRKRWLWLGLAVNLVPLSLFKYSGFAVGI